MQNKKLPSDWLNELKAKNDIVTTISSYIPVVKKGRSYWARCPFHHEKTPSFAINNDEQYYHCFGCGESGDVITFVEKIESISTGDAIRKLAEKAGLSMPMLESGEKIAIKKKKKDEVLKALDYAKNFYMRNLYEQFAKPAQEYIKTRGFKKSDLDRFEIGYSNSNTVIPHLESKGITRETMLEAGIIGVSKTNRHYDHIYNRLVFPIANTFGDCVGFSGRILEKNSDKAKYKNTSQTIVFDKSSLIYGLHLLKEAKRNGELENIILVEGQIDVIMMHSFGFKTAVASLGTAFTDNHARQLKRISDKIILLFDNDLAGQKATLRTVDILKPFGFNIKIARLPVDSDPDDYLKQKGRESMKEVLNKSKTPIEYQLDLFKENCDFNKPNNRAKYVRSSLELVSQLPTMSEREVYFKIISENASIPLDILRRDSMIKNVSQKQKKETDVLISNENGNIKAVKYVITSILQGELFANIDIDIKNYIFNPKFKRIIREYEQINEKNAQKKLIVLLNKLQDDDRGIVEDLLKDRYLPDKKYFDECVWKIVEETLLAQQEILNEEYKNSEIKEERQKIVKKLNEIVKQLRDKRIY